MRRPTALIAAAALALALAACGTSSGGGGATTTTPSPPDDAPAAAESPADAGTAAAATTAPGPNPIDAGAEDAAAHFLVDEWSDAAYEATDLRFLPDGRALVLTKGGWGGAGTGLVQLLDARGRFIRTLLELPVCTDAERGLLGLAIDPDLAGTGRIYLYYTRQMSGCALAQSLAEPQAAPVWNRVSSFAFDEDGIDPASERVLVDELPGHAGSHNGGGLAFLPDGTLLVAVGEAGYGRSRDLDVPTGKLLRIRVAGAAGDAPADNPHAAADASPVRALVYASGLRNPFRIAVDPESGDLAAADVGSDVWEEIDLVEPGGDYGFPDVEGPGTAGGSLPPLFAYRHEGGCSSVIGGAWLPGAFVGDAARSVYVFSDLGCPGVWALEPGAPGEPAHVTRVARDLPRSPASLVPGPDGAVYVASIGPGPGPIIRIAPNG